ncbi:MAG: hypothetical protein JWN84_1343 [Nocardioides sp.]|jgi:hypothetical protein|nr:hypothetical protein [Nocardioides sp.]
MSTLHPSSPAWTTPPAAAEVDQALVHDYIRRFGRRPSPGDLTRYHEAQVGLAWRLAARTRRRASLVITRL